MAVQDICYEYVGAEDFSQFKCLLSNFQKPLLNIIMTIVKNYIHVCRWTTRFPTVSGFVKALDRARTIHFKKCNKNNSLKAYHKLWDTLAHDVAMNDIIKTWESIEDN